MSNEEREKKRFMFLEIFFMGDEGNKTLSLSSF